MSNYNRTELKKLVEDLNDYVDEEIISIKKKDKDSDIEKMLQETLEEMDENDLAELSGELIEFARDKGIIDIELDDDDDSDYEDDEEDDEIEMLTSSFDEDEEEEDEEDAITIDDTLPEIDNEDDPSDELIVSYVAGKTSVPEVLIQILEYINSRTTVTIAITDGNVAKADRPEPEPEPEPDPFDFSSMDEVKKSLQRGKLSTTEERLQFAHQHGLDVSDDASARALSRAITQHFKEKLND